MYFTRTLQRIFGHCKSTSYMWITHDTALDLAWVHYTCANACRLRLNSRCVHYSRHPRLSEHAWHTNISRSIKRHAVLFSFIGQVSCGIMTCPLVVVCCFHIIVQRRYTIHYLALIRARIYLRPWRTLVVPLSCTQYICFASEIQSKLKTQKYAGKLLYMSARCRFDAEVICT